MSSVKVLLVEDDSVKRGVITHSLSQVSEFDADLVTHAPDAITARRLLASETYDLLILDIAIPRRVDTEPTADEGLRLLEDIMSDSIRFRTPAHIIGITAYPEVYARAFQGFSSRLLTLLHYDPASSDWEYALQARVRHIVSSLLARAATPTEYQSFLGVVCALYSPELTSVLHLPWSWEQTAVAGDHTIYWRGKFERNGVTCIVHAAAAALVGMPAMAVLATKMIYAFRPQYVGMAGIMAGIKGKVEMGDIVVADPSWDWGSGKWAQEGEKSPRFLAAPHQLRLSADLREKLRRMSQDVDALSRIRSDWPAEKPASVISVHIGPSASGASVLADRQSTEAIRSQHRDLRGVEMETYALFAAAEEVSEPRPTAFSIKSIVDFADGQKDDKYQTYGAFVSARALQYFAEHHL
jgi:nucleoside phosphorylase